MNIREIDRSSQALMALIEQYGSKNIPERALDELGYIRVIDEDGSVRIVNKKSQTEGKSEKPTIESKYEKKPFGVIEFKTRCAKVVNRQSQDLFERVRNKLRSRNSRSIDSNAEINFLYPPAHPIWVLKKELNDFLVDCPSIDINEREYFKEYGINLDQWLNTIEFDENEGAGGLLYDLDYGEGFFPNSPEEAEKFLISAERVKAQRGDKEVLKKSFTEYYGDTDIKHFWSFVVTKDHQILERFGVFCTKNNIQTSENFIVFFLIRFIQAQGLVKDSSVLGQIREFDQLTLFLRQNNNLNVEKKEKIKEIKNRLNTASIDERRVLSGEVKYLEEQQKHETQLLKGILAILEPYNDLAHYYRAAVDEIVQSVVKKGSTTDLETVYLDANYNRELDSDPGKISGDCTVGKPLPFKEPSYPIYNIKVFNEEKKHTGNIYLLRTRTEDDKFEVWQLNAIQIPASYDWDDFVKNMFARLGEEACKYGVKYISVNNEIDSISNYEYISKAIVKNIGASFDESTETVVGTSIEVKIPHFGFDKKTYSQPQGSNENLVVWENKNI